MNFYKNIPKIYFIAIAVMLLAASCNSASKSPMPPKVQQPTSTPTAAATPSPTPTPKSSSNGGSGSFSNNEYGISFKYPEADTFTQNQDLSFDGSNFVNQQGRAVFGSLQIPKTNYPGSNFVSGTFVASVSSSITNQAACNQFSDVNRMPSQSSSITVNGISYSVGVTGGAAAGTDSADNYYHTYQNGFCYEFNLEVLTFNRGDLDNPSSVKLFDDTDNLQNTFLSALSFFSPSATPPAETSGGPAITAFTSSSKISVNDSVSSGITFLWTTSGVDYVQLQYSCTPNLVVVDGASPQCQNIIDPPSSPNYSPNASTTIIFGLNNTSQQNPTPTSAIITLVPFVNATADLAAAKTLSITIVPTNWHVYSDTSYGFEIALPPDNDFMGEMVEDPTGAFVLTKPNQEFNQQVGSATGSPYVALNALDFNKAPTNQQIQQACQPGGSQIGPNGGLFCDGRDVSQEDLTALSQAISAAAFNQNLTLPSFMASVATTGTVVDVDGQKALLILSANTQALGTNVALYWFDQSSDLLDIYQELATATVAEATQSAQYQTFMEIVSALNFNN